MPSHLNAEVVSDVKRRQEAVRIKHRLGENAIKMYDKQGSVLRVETTINDAAGCRQTPKVGAVCGKAARTVPCEGAQSWASLPRSELRQKLSLRGAQRLVLQR